MNTKNKVYPCLTGREGSCCRLLSHIINNLHRFH